MDNLTHTIAGLWAGEVASQAVNETPSAPAKADRRIWFLWVSAIANNFPDLDLVLYGLMPKPLGYLLHHRGHSHTLSVGVLEAAFIFAGFFAVPAFRRFWRSDTRARLPFIALLCLGLCFHMAFDSLNSYGVHPFYPFNSSWFYGDLVFIIEPFLWVILGLPFALAIRGRRTRLMWYGFLFGMPLLFFIKKFLPWFSLAGLASVATVIAASRQTRRPMAPMLTSFALFVAFVGMQLVASRTAGRIVTDELHVEQAHEMVLDHALTPLPANPLCWSFVSVSRDHVDYTLRRGTLSLAPSLIETKNCFLAGRGLEEPPLRETGSILWTNEQKFSIAQLKSFWNENCFAQGWLRFARAPAFENDVMEDWRFAFRGAGGFSILKLEDFKNQKCPSYVPPWVPPREDLLR